ncbi:MAG: CRISPR system precrRNA processing endoribonuclease RAMP protein Cas6, partial [Candidatus Binatia bacterium]
MFQPFVPEGSEKLSRNRDIPRPFVIKAPLETKETYLPGERLSFDLVLVGKIKEYLPYFIVTFKELSQAGLGRGRAPLDLVGVESIGVNGESVPVYSRENNLVQPPRESIVWENLTTGSDDGNGFKNVRKVTLEFLTPTMLKADGLL